MLKYILERSKDSVEIVVYQHVPSKGFQQSQKNVRKTKAQDGEDLGVSGLFFWRGLLEAF